MTIPSQLLTDIHSLPGFDEHLFVAAHDVPPPVSVRRHPLKGAGLFANHTTVKWCSDAVYLKERPVFTLDPAFHGGAYYVQEASSMFLQHILHTAINDRRGLRVLDLCAAPGGKSTLIASLLDEESLLISNEVIRSRASILEENVCKWGYINNWVCSNDPRDIGRLHGYFDIIVVDAPCSGSGLWRKDPNALNEWSEANVALCAARQQRILADVWPALKKGGILIYATCSYSPQENEEVLDWAAATWSCEQMPVTVPQDWNIDTVYNGTRQLQGFRFFPHKVAGEGFFIAPIVKTEESGTIKNKQVSRHTPDKNAMAAAARYLSHHDMTVTAPRDNVFQAVAACHWADISILEKHIYLRRIGTSIGEPAGKDWIPAHDIALSIYANEDIPAAALSREQALRFLKREDPQAEGLQKGWYLMRYNGLGLGWVKSLGNRVNNYLPKQWRIRMDIDDSQ